MVVKMMKWRMPWPPLTSKKYEVKLRVVKLEVGNWVHESAEKNNGGLAVEIKWKGPKTSLGSFRKTVKRNCTKEEVGKTVQSQYSGVLVEWNEEFRSVCNLSGHKDNGFHPWEINFNFVHVLNQGSKNKFSVIGSASLNLAEYASKIDDQEFEIKIPLTVSNNSVEPRPMLYISLNLMELSFQEPTEAVQSPIGTLESPSAPGGTCTTEKDELSALKAGLSKVKLFTDYMSSRRPKKAHEEVSEGPSSTKSDDGEYAYPFDSGSLGETEEAEAESEEVNADSAVRKSCSYGTLAFANYAGVACYSGSRETNEDEDWVYFSNRRKSDVGCSRAEDPDILEHSAMLNSKRSILPWRKRKLSFRSPKAKGEPLLKKAYAEEGGDDIDFDRRQLSSDESISMGWQRIDEDSGTNRSSISEFGDDGFVVGTWEQKEILSRDGHMKIQTEVFFASIDQRNERASGESACTTLVAVIADWLQNNRNLMPNKSQFDSLIRDGSLEWRNLCENETYKERFPDKHFDLETVIKAKIWDICVTPEKSFIGFFHPDEMNQGNFDFLNSAMSFDDIWDEIASLGSSSMGESLVYIVSWNDHFFVLKVEMDAFYIIDTLGERLHEGCNQAYILKFDRNTTIYKLPSQSLEEKPASEQLAAAELPRNSSTQPTNSSSELTETTMVRESEEEMKDKEEELVVCQGKESCKEYIKSFLAAIPIRELQMDIKKGLPMSRPLHHRLQIELHFTQLRKPASLAPPSSTAMITANVVDICT